MADPRVWLRLPNGKPYWLIYGIRRISDGRMIYIGRTTKLLHIRWGLHLAKLGGTGGACRTLSEWLLSGDLEDFAIVALACSDTKGNASRVESALIQQWDTLLPNGANDHLSDRHRAVLSETQRRYNAQPDVKQKKSEFMRQRMADPDARAQQMRGLERGPERDARQGAVMRQLWQTPEYYHKVMSARHAGYLRRKGS